MIVADASVLIALVVQDHPGAAGVQDVFSHDHEWAAPALWRSEVASGILKYVRADLLDLDQVGPAFDVLEEIVGTAALRPSPRTVRAAFEAEISAYDAQYVQLARAIGTPLVTLDARLANKLPEIARLPQDYLRK